jgi:outer membrane protein assembly factor BamB
MEMSAQRIPVEGEVPMPSTSKSTVGDLLFVGIKGHVVAIRKSSGAVVWSVRPGRGSTFVPIVQEGDRLYTASGGEVSCLDAATGKLLWCNPLKGYGVGYAALAGAGFPTAAAALEQAAQDAAAGAVAVAAGG